MIPIMSVYGTRPEAIKMMPVVQALHASTVFRSVVTVTGQHREILDQVNELFGIRPDHDLDLIAPRQPLTHIAASVLGGLEPVIAAERPAALLVQGDTSSAVAAAIAGAYHRVPVVHIEAGLRSGDISSPFPEELNRKIVSQIASLHLAPTLANRDNLLRDGVDPRQIVVTGNTVIDALLATSAQRAPFADERLSALVGSGTPIILATVHRRESLGDPMVGIARALSRVARKLRSHTVVLPLHPNPAVRDVFIRELSGASNVLLIDPLDYAQFTHLLSAATIVLTDSGGVQEEAPSLGKPVLVLRDTTERPEAVAAGTSRVIGTDENVIVTETLRLLLDADHYAEMANSVSPYGDGRAAARTVAAIEELLGVGNRMPDYVAASDAPARGVLTA